MLYLVSRVVDDYFITLHFLEDGLGIGFLVLVVEGNSSRYLHWMVVIMYLVDGDGYSY